MESENKFLVPLAIIVAGALVGGAVFFKSNDGAPTPDDGTSTKIEVVPVSQDDHVLGNPNASVVVIEYSDVDCPYCKDFHGTMHRIVDELGKDGKVAWVYRHFPLDQLHPEARKKAEAAECVASLGSNEAFWEFVDILFARSETAADLPSIATEVGVDQTAFTTCLSEKRFADRVNKQGQDALKAGGTGTPYSILVGRDGFTFPINGAWPYEDVKEALTTMLTDPEGMQ